MCALPELSQSQTKAHAHPHTHNAHRLHTHRDMFGAPDVLIRKDKDFLASYTGVPSVTDDDLAPGAG